MKRFLLSVCLIQAVHAYFILSSGHIQLDTNPSSACSVNLPSLPDPSFTFCVWVSVIGGGSGQTVLMTDASNQVSITISLSTGSITARGSNLGSFDLTKPFHLTISGQSGGSLNTTVRQNGVASMVTQTMSSIPALRLGTTCSQQSNANAPQLSDLRVYNVVLTSSQIDTKSQTVLVNSTSESGLVLWYPPAASDILSGMVTDQSSSKRGALALNPYQVYAASNSSSAPFVPYKNLYFSALYNAPLYVGLNTPDSVNNPGNFAGFDANPLLTITPQRGACGQTNYVNLNYAGNSAILTVTVTSLPPSTASAVVYNLPLATNIIQFNTAATFGLPGQLGANEYVNFVYGNNTSYNSSCTAVSSQYTNSSQLLNCTVPPSDTNVTFAVMNLCGSLWTAQRQIFTYLVPNITNVISVANNRIHIVGQNLLAVQQSDLQVSVDNISWTVRYDLSNTTLLVVEYTSSRRQATIVRQLTSGNNYTFTANYLNQFIYTTPFTFNLTCPKGCVNGNCTSSPGSETSDTENNFCLCDTYYEGTNCTSNKELFCDDCTRQNGTCPQTYTNGVALYVCIIATSPDSVVPHPAPNRTGLIVGIVVGVAVLLAVLAVVAVFLYTRRRYKRYNGEAFIPLENKNFEKIMYGPLYEQPNQKIDSRHAALEKYLVDSVEFKPITELYNAAAQTDIDLLVVSIVVMLHDHKKVPLFLNQAFLNDLRRSEGPGTLFRNNSMSTKMFSCFAKLIGVEYMYGTIGPEIADLLSAETKFEVDPERMEEGQDSDEARWFLMGHTQRILKSIFDRADQCPKELCEFFLNTREKVGALYPGSQRSAIGGFVFLRYFCPAVSTPEQYGVTEERPHDQGRRTLILITKILQNLSNDVRFGDKEKHMAACNDFLDSNHDKLDNYYEKLLKVSNKTSEDVTVPRELKNKALHNVYNLVAKYLDKISDPEVKQEMGRHLQP